MAYAEIKPTPRPQMIRPAAMTPMLVDAVSRIHPTVKIAQPIMMVDRRPMKSARSPAMMAPKNVPADRIEVVRDCSQAGSLKTLVV